MSPRYAVAVLAPILFASACAPESGEPAPEMVPEVQVAEESRIDTTGIPGLGVSLS